jgi:hypothetical protein
LSVGLMLHQNTKEAASIVHIITTESASTMFWCMCHAVYILARWGHQTIGWLHGCPCHDITNDGAHFKKGCVWNGRRAIELAMGYFENVRLSLLALVVDGAEPESPSILQKLERLATKHVQITCFSSQIIDLKHTIAKQTITIPKNKQYITNNCDLKHA